MRYLVAIPVYNEARYLPTVLALVRQHAADIVVINDGSTDATPDLLADFPDVASLHHPTNQGYGQSIIDAFNYADAHGYDWVITMDCDEQHEPAEIPLFVERMAVSDADVISGSRYRGPQDNGDAPPSDRRAINHVINNLLHQMLGLKLTDSFCGFKAHRVASIQRLALTEPGYAFPLQFWVQVVRAGLRVEELAVQRIYRDDTRVFGGLLDNAPVRLQHYLEVFLRELRNTPVAEPEPACCGCGASTQPVQR